MRLFGYFGFADCLRLDFCGFWDLGFSGFVLGGCGWEGCGLVIRVLIVAMFGFDILRGLTWTWFVGLLGGWSFGLWLGWLFGV